MSCSMTLEKCHMRLIQFVDTKSYVQSNCWQHQLLACLRSQCDDHHIIEAADLTHDNFVMPRADVYLSTLKLRTLGRLRSSLRDRLDDRRLYVYDQDPWENFIDQGSCHGTYEWLHENMNVSFMLTSRWWTDYVASQGFRTTFTRMWLDTTLCDHGINWKSRPVTVGFMGTLHSYRKRSIDELKKLGIEIKVFPSKGYLDYLQTISQMQFFFHEEALTSWTIKGVPVNQNALWAKEIEIAARGCFPLRKYEPESEAYYTSQIPGIMMFQSLDDVPWMINLALNDPASDQRSRQSVDFIKSQRGWFSLKDLVSSG